MKLIVPIILLFIFCSCHSSNDLEIRGDCYPNRDIIKEAVNVKGRVEMLDQNYPDIWAISSMEGIIGEEGPTYDSRDVVIPCKLSEMFKEEGIMVEFSGVLKDTQDDFTGGSDGVYYENVYYIDISSIKVVD